MKIHFVILLFLLFAGCDQKADVSEVQASKAALAEPIVGSWDRAQGTHFRSDGTYVVDYENGKAHGEWRRVPGRLWKFTWSEKALEDINSNGMLPPFIPSYTLSEHKPKEEDVGVWSEVLRGGVYETRQQDGAWEDGLQYTVDGDLLVEDQGDYSNHFHRSSNQAVAGQPATRSELEPKGGDKPQSESEERSRQWMPGLKRSL